MNARAVAAVTRADQRCHARYDHDGKHNGSVQEHHSDREVGDLLDVEPVADLRTSLRKVTGLGKPGQRDNHGAAHVGLARVNQVHLDFWSRGRVAAYVLAGELAAVRGDHRTAFERYGRLVRPYGRGTEAGTRQFRVSRPATEQKIAQYNRAFLPVGGVIRYMSAGSPPRSSFPNIPATRDDAVLVRPLRVNARVESGGPQRRH